MQSCAKRILMLFSDPNERSGMRSAVRNHVSVLEESPHDHTISYANVIGNVLILEGGESDADPMEAITALSPEALILHNTFLCWRWSGPGAHEWKQRFDWIRDLDCIKIAVPQDEYDHAGTLDEWLLDWDVDHVMTIFGEDTRPPLYPLMQARAQFHRCHTGYVDERFASRTHESLEPIRDRAVDICYRARHLPYWFGSAGQLKHRVGDVTKERATNLGYRVDISTDAEDAIVGPKWLDFLASSKAVIGCEGGSSVLDWRGEIRAQIGVLLADNPDATFEEVASAMPEGWDEYEFLAVSPRHFEAVATKTAQILVRGEYSGILEPEKHYIPLEPDFSNIDEALARLEDVGALQKMVDRAYDEIIVNHDHGHRQFAAEFDRILAATGSPPSSQPTRTPRMDPVDALERALVAERQERALLRARVEEARQEAQHARRRDVDLEAEISRLHALLEVESARASNRRRLLIVVFALGLAVVSAMSAASLLLLLRLPG